MKAQEIGNTAIPYWNTFNGKEMRVCRIIDWLTKAPYTYIEQLKYLYSFEYGTPAFKACKQNNIPLCMISCMTDRSGCRGAENIAQRYPYIAIDIDFGDNKELMSTKENIETIKKWLFSLNFVYAVSKSCSGRGLFAICLIDEYKTNLEFKAMFDALQEDFASRHIVIDKSCSNINRTRFLGADGHPLIKSDDTEIIPYTKKKYPETKLYTKLKCTNKDIDEDFVRGVIRYCIDNGFQTNDYTSWYKTGLALHVLGDEGYDLFMEISQQSDGYRGESDVRKKWASTDKTEYDWEDLMVFFCSWAKKRDTEYWKEVRQNNNTNKIKLHWK